MAKHIITLTALGPDGEDALTLGALHALRTAKRLVLRTARHGVAAYLTSEGVPFETMDALYDESEDFDALCAQIRERLIAMARETGTLCYAVSDPANDATVRALCAALPEDIAVQLCGVGVSLADMAACHALALGVNVENLRTVTALSIAQLRPQADTPQVITEIDSRYIASDVKLWLGDLLDDETTVYFWANAADPAAQPLPIPLCMLDRQAHYDHRSAVLVPAVSVFDRPRATFEDFVQVVARLRGPGGCPWDRQQTMHSLRRYMIEEACEAADAMDGDDPLRVADELGDVLLQVVLNSAIAAEHRDFTDRDVTSMAAHKMIARHEHVFGGAHAENAQAVEGVWERAKARERGEQTALARVLDVPASLPGLMRAQKVLRREAQAQGRKLTQAEALAAIQAFASAGKADELTLGTLLEAACVLAEALSLDAETALRAATQRRIDALRKAEM